MTFDQAVQKWLDYKWPKRYTADTVLVSDSDTGSWIQIGDTVGHLLCVSTGGATCKRDFRKDRHKNCPIS